MPPVLGCLVGVPRKGAGLQSSSRAGRSGAAPKLWVFPTDLGDFPYFFGFLGEISVAGPGAGISMGNMSTHISRRPCRVGEVQSAPRIPPCSQTP